MIAEAPPRRVRQKRIAAVTIISAVVTIVIGSFAVITRAGSEDNFIVSGITALIFLPSLIAGMRLQRDQTAIFVCNVLMFVSLLLSASSPPVFLLTLIGVAVAWVLTILWSLDRFLFLYGLVWRWQG
jgi:predicted benzoate:H+ symporter BenE